MGNLGVVVIACLGLFGLSAYLAAVLRRRWAWIAFTIATLLVVFPAAWTFLIMTFDPPGGGMILGSGMFLLFVAGPLAVAWLLGLGLGLWFRWIRTTAGL